LKVVIALIETELCRPERAELVRKEIKEKKNRSTANTLMMS